jgi:ADP-ribosylation factor GTPase-activating protein 2/3
MPEVTSPADAQESTEDDFFSSWDKPAAAKTPTSSAPTTPPVVGRSSPLGNGAAATAPRTITSSSLRSSSSSSSRPASKLGASRLNSSSSTVSSAAAPAAKKSKLGGLGAKKAVSPLDFAEAERKATEEAERIKQLGYDRLKEEEEERARAKKAEEELKSSRSLGVGKVEKSNGTVPTTVSKPRGTTQDMERLGMGMKKMGFGSVPAASAPASIGCGGCFIV